MGRTATSKYVVSITVPGYSYSLAAWRCNQDGRPTDVNLAKYVESFEAGTQPGGCNAHLGAQYVSSAYVKINSGYDGRIVATYRAPMFRAVAGHLVNQES